jgi:hypothetical protein
VRDRAVWSLAATAAVLGVCALAFTGSAGAAGLGAAQSGVATGSAQCDSTFHYVPVNGAVNIDGSPTGIEYLCQTGSARGPLLVYVDGAGGCNSGDSCYCQPDPTTGSCTNPNAWINMGFFDKATSDDGRTWDQTYFGGAGSHGVFGVGPGANAFNGPTSPFNRNWNIVYIPATTGDAFLGNKVRQLTTSTGYTYTAHFVGYRNVQLDLSQIRTLFPSPSKVAVWGISGGGVGLTCSLGSFRATWPNAPMWMMDNAGPAYGSHDLMPQWAATGSLFGAWKQAPDGGVIPETCPIIPNAGSRDWSMDWVVAYDAKTYPDVTKAVTDDYSDYAVDGFACFFGATPDASESCASTVANTLNYEFNDVIRNAANFKVFYHTGTCHFERESDANSLAFDGLPSSCNYDKMQQNGAHFNDWVNAWITDSPAWVNVR